MLDGKIIQEISVMALPFLFAITLHEMAHGWMALQRGDTTARDAGRITLNPAAHIDPFGTIFLPLILKLLNVPFLMGYAKPVPVNIRNLKDPQKDMALVAAAGPACNFVMAVASGLLHRIITYFLPGVLFRMDSGSVLYSMLTGFFDPFMLMLEYAVILNIFFCFLNLIPILPLDGGRIVAGVLPYEKHKWFISMEPYGIMILMGVFFINPFHILDRFFFPVVLRFALSILGSA